MQERPFHLNFIWLHGSIRGKIQKNHTKYCAVITCQNGAGGLDSLIILIPLIDHISQVVHKHYEQGCLRYYSKSYQDDNENAKKRK